MNWASAQKYFLSYEGHENIFASTQANSKKKINLIQDELSSSTNYRIIH